PIAQPATYRDQSHAREGIAAGAARCRHSSLTVWKHFSHAIDSSWMARLGLIKTTREKIIQGIAKLRKLKLEVLFLQALRDNVASVERKVWISPQKPSSSESDHPRKRRQADGHADRPSQLAHERLLRDGIG